MTGDGRQHRGRPTQPCLIRTKARTPLAAPRQHAQSSPRLHPTSQTRRRKPSRVPIKPALKFPADGAFHPIVGNPYYDEASVAVVDATTVKRAFRKSGKTVAEATVTLAADGQSSSSAFVDRTAPSGVEVTGTTVNARVAPAPAGAHALSGAWRETTETQVSDTGLVFTFAQDGKTMAFSTPTGISYAATIDGPPATVTGDPGWTKVALKQTGPTTLFETDYEGDTPIGTYSMSVSPDGTTMTTAVNDLKHGKTSTMVAHRQ
ncbi:hypothetical protein [Sphingomonas sp. BK481]|uniref:hypothetical protein n=1 Tax=Sphingomonas sp. BK481 TaxID=2586981 RepID=UPI00161CB826|nr:hypothetical protein [Sphingomonas sp. BK481]MBB3588270.1 hypothetical protein [Sphingomonas sp. BK481]